MNARAARFLKYCSSTPKSRYILAAIVGLFVFAQSSPALTYPSGETMLTQVTWVSPAKCFVENEMTVTVRISEVLTNKPAGGPVRLMYSTTGFATHVAYAWADYKDGIAAFKVVRPDAAKGVLVLVALYDGSDRAFSMSAPLIVTLK